MTLNKRIPLIDVASVTKDMFEFLYDEKYEIMYVPYVDNNENFVSVLVCNEKDASKLKKLIEGNTIFDKYLLKNEKKFCYITTYKGNKIGNELSFDMNDDYPIKEEFTDNYAFLKNFFQNFISFRNNLISNNEVVKRDDIYQYYLSVIGFSGMKRVYCKKKILNKFNNSFK